MPSIPIDIRSIALPIQPQILAGLLTLDSNSNMSFGQLDRLIRSDASISALILKAANSAFYSRGAEIRTLQQAIARIGFTVVRSLALVGSTRQLFESTRYARFRKLVFEHSLVTALIARQLARRLGKADLAEEAFVCGLLHDLAKVVLSTHDRQLYIAVIDMAQERGIPFAVAERELFGTDHHALGQLAVAEWKLAPLYARVLAEHEGPQTQPLDAAASHDDFLLSVVGYANFLAKRLGHGHFCESDLADEQHFSAALRLSEPERATCEIECRDTIATDEHFRFFMSLI